MTQKLTPSAPTNESSLDDLLSQPVPGVGSALANLDGDIVILGAGGKIGPSMTRMARRALDEVGSSSTVYAVSRFSDPRARAELDIPGVEVVSADLGESGNYADLPDAAGVFYLAATKFGTTGAQGKTWWSNAAIPALVAQRYRGVPTVCYSTGNVYPLTLLSHGGSAESDAPQPLGEYAQSCLARERLFEFAAQEWATPVSVFRLNYACELRYGVIADLAMQISAGRAVDISMPAVNLAWQGDTNAWALRCIEHAAHPAPFVLNATGPETIPVRRLATWLAEDMNLDLELAGEERDTALLSDASLCHEMYGYPSVTVRQLVRWVAQWVAAGGRQLDKATKFQRRDGAY